ncbi:MAG: hypothetical protein Q9217_006778 [Psora testacea]
MDEEEFLRIMREKANDPETSESEVDEDKVEEYLDRCWSPEKRLSKYWTPTYQARRDARKEAQEARRIARRNVEKHAISPPATPPHLQQQEQAPQAESDVLSMNPEGSAAQNCRRISRKAPRRPMTRSQGLHRVSLLPKKGMVRFWSLWAPQIYVDMSYTTYLRDFVSGCSKASHRPVADSCFRTVSKSELSILKNPSLETIG